MSEIQLESNITELKTIKLNVGGKIFQTHLDTIRKYPDTMLERMYSSQLKVEEVLFFDRSSELFDSILNFYRTGLISNPFWISSEVWTEELRYWGSTR